MENSVKFGGPGASRSDERGNGVLRDTACGTSARELDGVTCHDDLSGRGVRARGCGCSCDDS